MPSLIKSLVRYGVDSTLKGLLEWVQPLSPVIGWNKGGEFQHIGTLHETRTHQHSIRLVHEPEPAEHSTNSNAPTKINSLHPEKINWNDSRQFPFLRDERWRQYAGWTFGDFISSKDYWSNPANTEHQYVLHFLCGQSLRSRAVMYMIICGRRSPKAVSVVEYGGGYFYPGPVATATGEPDRWLRELARRDEPANETDWRKSAGLYLQGICPARQRSGAYRIFAEEIEDLTGIIAVQYSPYCCRKGKDVLGKE